LPLERVEHADDHGRRVAPEAPYEERDGLRLHERAHQREPALQQQRGDASFFDTAAPSSARAATTSPAGTSGTISSASDRMQLESSQSTAEKYSRCLAQLIRAERILSQRSAAMSERSSSGSGSRWSTIAQMKAAERVWRSVQGDRAAELDHVRENARAGDRISSIWKMRQECRKM
jgi:hypothetical protein